MMGNQRWQHHKGGGAKTGEHGTKKATVGPIKTRNWPEIPGKTQPKTRNFGMKKMCQGLADKGI